MTRQSVALAMIPRGTAVRMTAEQCRLVNEREQAARLYADALVRSRRLTVARDAAVVTAVRLQEQLTRMPLYTR